MFVGIQILLAESLLGPFNTQYTSVTLPLYSQKLLDYLFAANTIYRLKNSVALSCVFFFTS